MVIFTETQIKQLECKNADLENQIEFWRQQQKDDYATYTQKVAELEGKLEALEKELGDWKTVTELKQGYRNAVDLMEEIQVKKRTAEAKLKAALKIVNEPCPIPHPKFAFDGTAEAVEQLDWRNEQIKRLGAALK